MKIAPSLLANSDWLNLRAVLRGIEARNVDALHIDVMDGHFVPNLAFGIDLVCSIKRETTLPLDVHLMASCLDDMLDAFIDIKPHAITLHAEVARPEHLQKIMDKGITPGLALKPETPVDTLFSFSGFFKKVIIMTVNPGFSGQKLMGAPLDKISHIKGECWVDGGVNYDNLNLIEEKGAFGVVMGAAFFNPDL